MRAALLLAVLAWGCAPGSLMIHPGRPDPRGPCVQLVRTSPRAFHLYRAGVMIDDRTLSGAPVEAFSDHPPTAARMGSANAWFRATILTVIAGSVAGLALAGVGSALPDDDTTARAGLVVGGIALMGASLASVPFLNRRAVEEHDAAVEGYNAWASAHGCPTR